MGYGLVDTRLKTRALPVEGFVHPVPLLAMVVLALNDHLLKGSGWLPGWLTGKLSDIAGMIFFPLFVVALLNTVLFGFSLLAGNPGRGGAESCRLTRGKLITACLVTGIAFAAIQLWPAATELYVAVHRMVGVNARVTPDPTDLVALCCIPVTYLVGRGQMLDSVNNR